MGRNLKASVRGARTARPGATSTQVARRRRRGWRYRETQHMHGSERRAKTRQVCTAGAASAMKTPHTGHSPPHTPRTCTATPCMPSTIISPLLRPFRTGAGIRLRPGAFDLHGDFGWSCQAQGSALRRMHACAFLHACGAVVVSTSVYRPHTF